MVPSFDQIQHAAYLRWERRSYQHGQHTEDWLAAEQDLLFSLNYEVFAYYPIADGEKRLIGNKARPVCRFCERTAPGVSFRNDALALPQFLGNTSLFTTEECEECQGLFAEEVEGELQAFLSRFRAGSSAGARERSRLPVPIAALKGLTKLGLSILPRRELQGFEGAIEWVSNSDHDFDSNLFTEAHGFFHVLNQPISQPWVALARRTDADAPMPAIFFFLGTGHLVAQVALPLNDQDEELDGMEISVPTVSSPLGPDRMEGMVARVSLPIALAGARPVAFSR